MTRQSLTLFYINILDKIQGLSYDTVELFDETMSN